MSTARVYRRVKPFKGTPTDEQIQLQEEQLPKLATGDVLFEARYLSVDPYMRIKMGHLPDGSVMVGEQISRVAESQHPKFTRDALYIINSGWRSHTVVNPDQTQIQIKPLPAGMEGLPTSLALGTVGMPGATAYMGMVKVLNITAGKTVLVTAASGAVGQVACQIAKIKGLTVIGCAGSPEKCDFLKSIGVDVTLNYKTDDADQVLKQVAPQGIDYYVDNVGGAFTDNIIKNHLKMFGRAVIIGNISDYNKLEPCLGEQPWECIKRKCLRVEGMQVREFPEQDWAEAFTNISTWIKQGKLQYKEHVTEGFENMRQAFYQLFTGQNFGKALVKV